MSDFQRIDIGKADEIRQQAAAVVTDIRDEQSFQLSHVPGAIHLGNHNLADFVEDTDKAAPILVFCYHGHSSQSAAALLAGQGFTEVYSVDGGFEAWRQSLPVEG